MTDISEQHRVVDSTEVEEGDIAEGVPNLELLRKPSLPEERLHNTGDSESEEDLTEEHVDTHLLSTQLEDLSFIPTHEEPTESNAGTLQVEEQQDMIGPLTPIAAPQTTMSRGRSSSSVNPTTTSPVGLLPRSQRVWEMDRQAPECRRCHRRFNFLVRRHHCRRCGQIVCDKCSSNRIRLPVEELIEDPMVSTSQYPIIALQSQRVCDTCYREPIRRSSESNTRRLRTRPTPFADQMRRSDSSQSLMIDCPVCGHTFLGMPKNDQENHLQRCLNVGSPPVQSPRYIVYELSQDSSQIGEECPICFDEFEQGDKISRMICLCSYHQRCLADWLQRGKGCPVHYDPLQD
ncbi:hypothetical protein INT47_000658 [Mucor saturninus]|uniref:Uncharacterized protein n=1 Tax=Mucor saturninus TaxID=64648 RepID=A0A8H7RK96_9FUNG|nr:hypothetical protein INT47_000658 [Mucor saturninus]